MSKESALAALTGTTPAPQPVVAPTQTPETPIETTPQPDSARFAHLAKKEMEMQKQREALKAEREKLEKEKSEAQTILQREKEFEELKQKDYIAALKLKGFSEQQIINALAEMQPKELTPEEKAAKAAKEATDATLKAWNDEQLKKKTEEEKAKDAKLITGFKQDITKTIESQKDKYKFCAHYGAIAEDLIYETVLASARQSEGKDIMSRDEAIELAEEYYKEQYTSLKALEAPVEQKEELVAKDQTRTRTISDFKGEPVKEAPARVKTLSGGAVATTAAALARKSESMAQKRARLEQSLREGRLITG